MWIEGEVAAIQLFVALLVIGRLESLLGVIGEKKVVDTIC